MEQIFKAIEEKLKDQENIIYVQKYEIGKLKEENAKLKEENAMLDEALANAENLLSAKANNAEGGY